MSEHVNVETKLQTASQDYDCDFCGETIPDETDYVRVALVRSLGRRGTLPSAMPGAIEKYHPKCHQLLTGVEVTRGKA